jgi:hypothetical protein
MTHTYTIWGVHDIYGNGVKTGMIVIKIEKSFVVGRGTMMMTTLGLLIVTGTFQRRFLVSSELYFRVLIFFTFGILSFGFFPPLVLRTSVTVPNL